MNNMSTMVSSGSFADGSVNTTTSRRRRRSPTTFTKAQLETLESEFISNHYLDIYARERLATSLQLTESRIQVPWDLFQCSRFHEQRKKYLKRYYWKNPNTLKMDQLFNCEKKTILFNLTKFCSYIMSHV